MRRRKIFIRVVRRIMGAALIVWMLISSLSIAVGQVSAPRTMSCEELAAMPGDKYIYLEDRFRAIQKLESKSDYCDSIAVVNDSIIHHQRDRIAIQSAFIHTDSLALSSERETSKALQLQLNNQIQATKREKRKKAIPWGVAFIFGCLVILK